MSISRRSFLQRGAAAAAAFTIAPSSILGKSHGYVAPTDKLNIAAVGIGGMGHANISHVKNTENIVALCDVDWKYAKGVFDEFPNAKKYWDYRKMYDEMGKSIDGVIIATADHTHAIITADAMTLGKHVYCQKPLTHSVYESRLLTKLAETTGVVTQMGNQGASGEGTDLACEWIWNGEIGEVTKVECATDRPIWPQGLNEPEKADRVSLLHRNLVSAFSVADEYVWTWGERGRWWPGKSDKPGARWEEKAPGVTEAIRLAHDPAAYAEKIAAEKGGIIKPGCYAVMAEQQESAMDVVREICKQKQVPLT